MNARRILLSLLIVALVLAGTLGTETRLLLFWPAAGLLGFIGLLSTLLGRARVSSPPNDLCLAVCLSTFGYILFRAMASPVSSIAREDAILVLAAFVVYLTTLTWGSHPRWRQAIVSSVILLSVANLAIGWIHFTGDWEFHVLPGLQRVFEEGRIGGFYNNPNHLAASLSVTVFLSLGWLTFGRLSPTRRALLAFVAVLCMLGMALTVSRGALISLAAGGVGFLAAATWLLWNTHRHLIKRLGFGALVLVVLGSAILWKVNEAYLERRMARQGNSDVRLEVWQAAFTQHAQQPVVGQGARMFYSGGSRYRSPDLPPWVGEPDFVHSEPIQALADYGWLGLALILGFLGVHFWNGIRFLRWMATQVYPETGQLTSSRLGITLGAMTAVLASSVHACVEFHWHVGSLVILGAILFGILGNPGFGRTAPASRRLPVVRPVARLALPASATLLLTATLIYGRADWAAHRASLLSASDPEKASLLLSQAVGLDPRNSAHRQALAEALLDRINGGPAAEQQRLLDEASLHLEAACQVNPFHFVHATTWADVLQAQRRPEDALRQIRRAITLAPQHEEPRLALALFHHREGRFEEAEKAYLWAAGAAAANPAEGLTWHAAYDLMLETVRDLPSTAVSAAP